MLDLRFIPIFEDTEYLSAVVDYIKIWAIEQEKIINTLEHHTGLTFIEKRIAVVIYEGISFSGRNPGDIMKLRASYDLEVKKGTLIHELSHRLLFNLKNKPTGDEHKLLNLFLYDVWEELYGTQFAHNMVRVEKEFGSLYRDAWEYALSMDKDSRKRTFIDQRNLYA